MDRALRSNWNKAILINMVISVGILMCTHMVYETNDDYVISSRIAVGYSAVYFVNYYLCTLLVKMQNMTSTINVFVVAQIVTSFISWVCITKILLDKSKRITSTAAYVGAIAVLSFDSYCRIQFSKTAALACIAGMLLCIDAFANKRRAGYYIAGIILTYIGVAFRSDVLIVAIAYTGLSSAIMIMSNREEIKVAGHARMLAALMLMVVVAGGAYAVKTASGRVFESDEDLQRYKEYNALRSEVIDTQLLKGYENRLDEYDQIGISKNDLDLIKGWMFDYEGAASKENLELIVKLGDGKTQQQRAANAVKSFIKGTVSDLENRTTVGIRIFMMVLLAIWMLAFSERYSRLFIIAAGFGTVVLHIYLYYTGRPANRTMYIPDICAILTMLYVVKEPREKERLNSAAAVIITAIMIFLLIPTYKNAGQLFEKAEKNIMPKDFTEYIQDHKESFFLISTREKGSNERTLTPWKIPDVQGESNLLGTGSWGTMSPYVFNKLDDYSLYNPIKDIIDKDNAYYVGNNNIDKLTEYYNKWHADRGRQIYLEEFKEVAGKKIWKVKTRAY